MLPIVTTATETALRRTSNWIRPSRMNLILHPFFAPFSVLFHFPSPSSHLTLFSLTDAPGGAVLFSRTAPPGAPRKIYGVTCTARLLMSHARENRWLALKTTGGQKRASPPPRFFFLRALISLCFISPSCSQ